MEDEEDIGIDSPDGGDGIRCRTSVVSNGRSTSRTIRIGSKPGSIVRASLAFGAGNTAHGTVARLLAYVDPITGKGVVRMGLFEVSGKQKGKEIGKQIVWETDTPVWNGK